MMKNKEIIYNIEVTLPEKPTSKLIDGNDLPKKEQYFRRKQIPESFFTPEYDADGDVIYTPEELAFFEKEFDLIFNGYWFMNNGSATYITGTHYYFLNYWSLEDGNFPEYRDVSRRWFLFLEYCESKSYIEGIIRAKMRRAGASSESSAWLCKIATTEYFANCGIISKTGEDAKSLFKNMVVRGFRSLPSFFQPRTSGFDDPDKVLRFVKPPKKGKGVAKNKSLYNAIEGLNSQIDWKNTKLNSYDSTRQRAILIDEGGKWASDVPVSKYWEIVRQTLLKGAIKVGFALLPSTVNEVTREGGMEYKKLWDNSIANDDGTTATGLYRYFCPSYDGLEGYIGKYGESIINDPTKEQIEYIKEKWNIIIDKGARQHLEDKRKSYKDENSLNEFIRLYPFTEEEAFRVDSKKAYYNLEKIYRQMEVVKEANVKLRKGNLIEDKGGIRFEDASDGLWRILEPPNANACGTMISRGREVPANIETYCCGIDPFKNSILTGLGSQGVIVIGKKLNLIDPENSGYPIAVYIGRPRLKSLFHYEVLKACIWYGCTAGYESDAGDDYYEYFINKGKLGYLARVPDSAIKKETGKSVGKYGVASRDPYALGKMLESSIMYIENHCHKVWFDDLLYEHTLYDHDDRTKFDLMCAHMVMLMYMLSSQLPSYKKSESVAPKIATYKINIR